jgi:sugar phosphate isomerase/epimerase
MIALSTSWKSEAVADGQTLLLALKEIEVSEIELGYRITRQTFLQLREPLKRSGLNVVSIHNFFPFSPDMKDSRKDYKAGGDLFLLSHTDEEERRLAVRQATISIEYANDLEAEAVILHCGHVDMEPEIDRFHSYWKTDRIRSEEARAFITEKLMERDRRKAKHIDSLLFSLDRLIRVADKQNVRLALENRYHYHELPGPDDFDTLFAEFQGGPIGYWHDTGHAYAAEALTLSPEESLLATHSDRLLGIHFHDVRGLADHLAPGSGEIDFSAVAPFVREDTLLVMELKPGTPDFEVVEGLRFLTEKGIGRKVENTESGS